MNKTQWLEENLVQEDEQPYKLPENWLWITLEKLAKIKRGASPRPKGDPKFFDGDIPWLKISDLTKQGKYIHETEDSVTLAGKEKSVWVDPNTIILSISASVGRPAITKVGVCIHDGFVKIEENEKLIDKNYLYFYLVTALDQMLSKAKGATQININSNIVKNLAVSLPPLNEQKRIVERVESFYQKINKAKESINILPTKIQEIKKSILNSACNGTLTVDWRSSNGENKSAYVEVENCLKKRILEYEESKTKKIIKKPEYFNYNLKDNVHFSDVLPNSWVKATVGLLCDCIVPGRDKPKSFSGSIPWITTPDIISDYITDSRDGLNLSEQEISEVKAKVIPIDSVIMTCIGRFGISAVVKKEIVINQQLHAFLPSELILPEYLMYHIRVLEKYMVEISTSTTISYLNKTNCNSLTINLPPIAEQHEIVNRVKKMIQYLDRVLIKHKEIEGNIESISQSIVTKAFRGELGTNDPEEESALELLKQIQENGIR